VRNAIPKRASLFNDAPLGGGYKCIDDGAEKKSPPFRVREGGDPKGSAPETASISARHFKGERQEIIAKQMVGGSGREGKTNESRHAEHRFLISIANGANTKRPGKTIMGNPMVETKEEEGELRGPVYRLEKPISVWVLPQSWGGNQRGGQDKRI